MTKQELQAKMEALLLGKKAYDMMKLSHLVGDKLDEWFDNSQGYYSTRCTGYTIAITYKDRGLAICDLKRKKTTHIGGDCVFLVDRIVISDFIDTEDRVKAIKEQLAKENKDDWRFSYGTPKKDMEDCLRIVKEHFSDMKARDIKDMFYRLHQEFWNIEEELNTIGD